MAKFNFAKMLADKKAKGKKGDKGKKSFVARKSGKR